MALSRPLPCPRSAAGLRCPRPDHLLGRVFPTCPMHNKRSCHGCTTSSSTTDRALSAMGPPKVDRRRLESRVYDQGRIDLRRVHEGGCFGDILASASVYQSSHRFRTVDRDNTCNHDLHCHCHVQSAQSGWAWAGARATPKNPALTP